MAKVTINNSDKTGWLHICLNDYYNGNNGDSEHYTPIDGGIGGICVGKMDGVDYVELHIEHEDRPFYLTNGTGNDTVLQVDEVNGVPPASFADLIVKILALLP